MPRVSADFSRPVTASVLVSSAMISYERYTELLSKIIYKTITGPEKTVVEYETEQPKLCPQCRVPVMTFLEP
jgi:hypothetical protein